MLYTFLYYFLLFMIYSFIGWIMEVTSFLVTDKKFINRGFLIGPYCPIYGFCSVLMVLTFGKYTSTPLALFVMALVLCSVIEYLTSYIMEKLFNTRWWDYSDLLFNVNGRICLKNSVLFGLLGAALIYFINPTFSNILSIFPQDVLMCISLALLALFIADIIASFNIIARVKDTTNLVLKDSTEEITEKVKEILKSKSIWQKRLIDAFPNFKTNFKAKFHIKSKKD